LAAPAHQSARLSRAEAIFTHPIIFLKPLLIVIPLLFACGAQAQVGSMVNKVRQKAGNTTSNTASSSSGETSAPGDVTVEQVEDHQKKLLEDNGFYSALVLQGTVPEYYKSNDNSKTLGVVGLVSKVSPSPGEDDILREMNDFQLYNMCMFPEEMTNSRSIKIMDSDPTGYLRKVAFNGTGWIKDGFMMMKWQNCLVGLREVSKSEYRLICVPFKKDMTLAPLKKSLDEVENGLDESKVFCDVYTADRTGAKAADLAKIRAEMLAMMKSRAMNITKAWDARTEAEINAATFPVAAHKDAELEKNILEVVKQSGPAIDFDPAGLKKMILDAKDWSIRKNEYGVILGKTIPVTLGFSKDGHCYYVSIQIQKDYAGGGAYQETMYFNGFHTRWTELRCEKIK
jgi:hypothetical protein